MVPSLGVTTLPIRFMYGMASLTHGFRLVQLVTDRNSFAVRPLYVLFLSPSLGKPTGSKSEELYPKPHCFSVGFELGIQARLRPLVPRHPRGGATSTWGDTSWAEHFGNHVPNSIFGGGDGGHGVVNGTNYPDGGFDVLLLSFDSRWYLSDSISNERSWDTRDNATAMAISYAERILVEEMESGSTENAERRHL